jgi:hypothetical protein
LTTDNEQAVSSAGDDAPDESVLLIEIGGETVGARLEAAIASGGVIRRADGKFELRQPVKQPYLGKGGEFGPCCEFLNAFMFTHVYGEKAVPIGCRDCYKVKVLPETLRQLMAVNEIAQDFSCASKSGGEVDRPDNQSLYGSYFFLLGLDKARVVYRKLRDLIDAHPQLGAKVKMVIKRGCTNYEHACGPSDRYTFDPRLETIEKYFWSKFVRKRSALHPKYRKAMALLEMVRTAYRIGDDTYKDFTGGKDLLPPTLSYDPDPSAARDEIAPAP